MAEKATEYLLHKDYFQNSDRNNGVSMLEKAAWYIVYLNEIYIRKFGISYDEFELLGFDEQQRLMKKCRQDNRDDVLKYSKPVAFVKKISRRTK